MSTLLGTLLKPILEILGKALGFLFAYTQGKKVVKLEINEETLKEIVEDAQEAAKDKNTITNLDDDAIDNIVFRRNNTIL